MLDSSALTTLTLFTPSALSLFWAGTSFAIDQEAVVKFKTPSITKEIAFDVGNTVFTYQGNLESVLAVLSLGSAYYYKEGFNETALGVSVVSHIVQKAIFLSKLKPRALKLSMGKKLDCSHAHAVYVVVELIKLVSLFMV
eukprot:CFRG4546T1